MNNIAMEDRSPLVNQLSDTLQRLSGFSSAGSSQGSDKQNVIHMITAEVLGALGEGCISVSATQFREADLQSLRDHSLLGGGDRFTPFIESDGDIYLARYYHYARQLEGRLKYLASHSPKPGDIETSRTVLNRLFPDDPQLVAAGIANWQKVAAALALLKKLTVISGGPGTGKTTTVLKLLAALSESQPEGVSLKICLAAPTGKAAARMQDSIRSGVELLDCDECIKDRLRELKASTLHRLLGYKPNSVDFRHTSNNPLALDILVVDESSMIDTTMMAKLLDAVPNHAKVLLLGDKDQLPPVDPGNPFANICSQFGFSEEIQEQLQRLSGIHPEVPASEQLLSDNIVFLRHSYRFGSNSGIGLLASAINTADLERAKQLLADPNFEDITWQEYTPKEYRSYSAQVTDPLIKRMQAGYAKYLKLLKAHQSIGDIFEAFECFCVLVATNKGLNGLESINHLAKQALGFNAESHWYHGRPVMITSNDSQTKLYNGDVGLCLDIDGTSDLSVYFPGEDGFREFNCNRIPAHQTAFALTVHKSQGSEFNDVLFLLPDGDSKVLSKALIYTAVTRAKERVEVWGDKQLQL